MKKLALLLASISLVGMNLYAGELKSFTSEAVMNDLDSGLEHLELTVGKGTYQLNDNFNFIFDVDKDFITRADGTKEEGWDTQFGLVQNLGKVKGFDLSLNYLLRYDDTWNTKTLEKTDNDEYTQYIFSPYFSKDVKISGKDFSFGTELWAQVGGSPNKTLKDATGGEINFYLSGNLNTKLYLELGLYNLNYYSLKADKYQYTIQTEDTLIYSVPLKSGLSFSTKAYLNTYYNTDTEGNKIEAYIKPEIKYTKDFSNIKTYAAIGYEVFSYEASKKEAGTPSNNSWANNEMELTLGFKTK
ncbi:MAG: hypothetical protein JXM74_04505 [Fusobacteriaceae bacterium]|nr:hypothetical protein [Fusobacteriaceae bacterium]MBN2837996.1 hypothetical protein [Fusobacteriaceae bacterium]